MANGLAPYLLNDMKSMAGGAYAGTRIDLKGFLAMLVAGPGAAPIQANTLTGNKKEIRFWYRQRNLKAQVASGNQGSPLTTGSTAFCGKLLTPARLETTIAVNNTQEIAFHLSDELVASYTEEAAQRMQNPGVPFSGGATNEMMDIIMSGANGILSAINQDLLTNLLTWGKNKVTGTNTATTLNIAQAAGTVLTGGMPKLIGDYKQNNLSGMPNVVGSGLFLNYILSQPYKGLDSAGMNSQLATGMINFFPDQDFDSVVGSNQIGVFEPGSIQLAEYLEFTGFKAGVKPGDSEFGVLVLPAFDSMGNAIPIKLDYQLRYLSCATTLTDLYSGNSTTFPKGWSLILKKDYGLFQTPSDAYYASDANRSVNGALRYSVTNS